MENPEVTGVIQGRLPDGTFPPGVSGNPAGRPMGSKSFTTKVKEALEHIGDGNAVSYEEALIKKILHKAIVEGNEQMIKLMWNYIDGMPVQSNEFSGKGGDSIKVESVSDSELTKFLSVYVSNKREKDSNTEESI